MPERLTQSNTPTTQDSLKVEIANSYPGGPFKMTTTETLTTTFFESGKTLPDLKSEVVFRERTARRNQKRAGALWVSGVGTVLLAGVAAVGLTAIEDKQDIPNAIPIVLADAVLAVGALSTIGYASRKYDGYQMEINRAKIQNKEIDREFHILVRKANANVPTSPVEGQEL